MDFVFVVHTSEWIISKGLELTWVVCVANGCLACFPNWHASQTFNITFFVPNLGRPPTRFYFSISWRRWRLTWPSHLCQIPMSPTPFPCVNNMEFTSCMFTSKVNICPFLSPLQSICFGSSCLPQNIHLGWMSFINLVPPFGLQRSNFLLWSEHEVHLSSILFAHLAWTMAPCQFVWWDV